MKFIKLKLVALCLAIAASGSIHGANAGNDGFFPVPGEAATVSTPQLGTFGTILSGLGTVFKNCTDANIVAGSSLVYGVTRGYSAMRRGFPQNSLIKDRAVNTALTAGSVALSIANAILPLIPNETKSKYPVLTASLIAITGADMLWHTMCRLGIFNAYTIGTEYAQICCCHCKDVLHVNQNATKEHYYCGKCGNSSIRHIYNYITSVGSFLALRAAVPALVSRLNVAEKVAHAAADVATVLSSK